MAKKENEGEKEEGEKRGEREDTTVLYLVSSFGFLGSPGEWPVWGRATEEFHRAHRPRLSRRDGAAGFFVNDAILVDDAILNRTRVGVEAMGFSELL